MYLVSEIINGEHNVQSFSNSTELVEWLRRYDFGNVLIVTPNDYYYNKFVVIGKYENNMDI